MFRRVVNTHTHTCKKKKNVHTVTHIPVPGRLHSCLSLSLLDYIEIPVVVWLLLLTLKRNVYSQLMDKWMNENTHVDPLKNTHTYAQPYCTLLLCNDWTTGCLHYGCPQEMITLQRCSGRLYQSEPHWHTHTLKNRHRIVCVVQKYTV